MDRRAQGAPGTDMLGQLIIETLVRPRSAARQVLAAGVPQVFVLQGALLVVCVGMLLNFVALRMIPITVDPITASMLRNPVVGAIEELLFLALTVLLTVRVGRLFGGKGRFWDGLALLVWLNVVVIVVEAAQLLVLAVMPPIRGVIEIVAFAPLVWLTWVYANFVAELHGFQNAFFVLGAMLLTALVLFFGVSMVLVMLGYSPQRLT